jgi:sphingomyelin phosphodiesterase acid-like 3
MKTKPVVLICLRNISSVIAILFLCSITAFAQTDSIITISDIHFQPGLQHGGYKDDCDSGLFLSAIHSIQEINPNPAYIIIPGDLLCHDGVEKLSNKEKAEAIKYISTVFKNTFKHAVILPALGNNDTYLGDYAMEKNDPVFKMFFNSFFDKDVRGKIIDDKCNEGGYYAYRPQADLSLTIIVLNTTLFSADPRAKESHELADDELMWLNNVLDNCKGSVWLVYHIPPGKDGYYALKGKDVDLWDTQHDYYKQFLKIVTGHPNIKAQFAGHTHVDDFKLVCDEKGIPVSYIHIVPSVSPVHGNNPAFQQVYFDRHTYRISDYKTFYNPDSADWEQGHVFEMEYDFMAAFKNSTFTDMSNLAELAKVKSADNEKAALFEKYYTAGRTDKLNIKTPDWKKFFEYTTFCK